MEKNQVLEVLKPKAASFGFNDDELSSASEAIAGQHPEEATMEQVTAAVESCLPFLKLSQSAANRSFERLKSQFERDNQSKTKEQEEAERKAAEEAAENAKKTAQQQEPDWFKAYREAQEKRIKELETANAALNAERTDADFRKKAVAALEGVDESYYGLLLKGRKFSKQEEVDDFVREVKEGWEEMSKKLKINSLTNVRPPKTGGAPDNKPSAEVQERIERRKKAQQSLSPIRGLEPKK